MDAKAGNDQFSTYGSTQEHDLDGINHLGLNIELVSEEEDEKYESGKGNVCFYIFYSIFLISYIVCVLVIAFTYPLKPTCNFHLYVPGFDEDDLPSPPQQTEKLLFLDLTIINRNRLISSRYDPFNITIYYLPSKNTSIQLGSTRARGFDQKKMEGHTVMNLDVPAPRLPVLWQSQRPLHEITLRMNLEFTVRFTCKPPCHRKQRFLMSFDF